LLANVLLAKVAAGFLDSRDRAFAQVGNIATCAFWCEH